MQLFETIVRENDSKGIRDSIGALVEKAQDENAVVCTRRVQPRVTKAFVERHEHACLGDRGSQNSAVVASTKTFCPYRVRVVPQVREHDSAPLG